MGKKTFKKKSVHASVRTKKLLYMRKKKSQNIFGKYFLGAKIVFLGLLIWNMYCRVLFCHSLLNISLDSGNSGSGNSGNGGNGGNDNKVKVTTSSSTSLVDHDERWGDIYEDMPAKRKLALYDYDPVELSPNVDAEVELSFRAGDIILVCKFF